MRESCEDIGLSEDETSALMASGRLAPELLERLLASGRERGMVERKLNKIILPNVRVGMRQV